MTPRQFRRKNLGDNRYGNRVYEITHLATGTTVVVERREFDLPTRSISWIPQGTDVRKCFKYCDTLEAVENSLQWAVDDIANSLIGVSCAK